MPLSNTQKNTLSTALQQNAAFILALWLWDPMHADASYAGMLVRLPLLSVTYNLSKNINVVKLYNAAKQAPSVIYQAAKIAPTVVRGGIALFRVMQQQKAAAQAHREANSPQAQLHRSLDALYNEAPLFKTAMDTCITMGEQVQLLLLAHADLIREAQSIAQMPGYQSFATDALRLLEARDFEQFSNVVSSANAKLTQETTLADALVAEQDEMEIWADELVKEKACGDGPKKFNPKKAMGALGL